MVFLNKFEAWEESFFYQGFSYQMDQSRPFANQQKSGTTQIAD